MAVPLSWAQWSPPFQSWPPAKPKQVLSIQWPFLATRAPWAHLWNPVEVGGSEQLQNYLQAILGVFGVSVADLVANLDESLGDDTLKLQTH